MYKLLLFSVVANCAQNVTQPVERHISPWIFKNGTVYSTSSNSSYSAKFFNKYRESLEKGRALCPRSGNFNPDPSGPAHSFDGVYFEDDGPVGKLSDYQKCVYIVSTVALNWVAAKTACEANVVGACGITCPGTLVTIHSLKNNDKVGEAIYNGKPTGRT